MSPHRTLVAVALLSVASPAFADWTASTMPPTVGSESRVERVEPAGKDVSPTDGGYDLLVVTRDSAVRMTWGMTLPECEFARHRLLGEPATDKALDAADSAYMSDVGCRALVHGSPFDPYVDQGGGRCSGPGRAHLRKEADVASAECFR